jgi:hypothetical protein
MPTKPKLDAPSRAKRKPLAARAKVRIRPPRLYVYFDAITFAR